MEVDWNDATRDVVGTLRGHSPQIVQSRRLGFKTGGLYRRESGRRKNASASYPEFCTYGTRFGTALTPATLMEEGAGSALSHSRGVRHTVRSTRFAAHGSHTVRHSTDSSYFDGRRGRVSAVPLKRRSAHGSHTVRIPLLQQEQNLSNRRLSGNGSMVWTLSFAGGICNRLGPWLHGDGTKQNNLSTTDKVDGMITKVVHTLARIFDRAGQYPTAAAHLRRAMAFETSEGR